MRSTDHLAFLPTAEKSRVSVSERESVKLVKSSKGNNDKKEVTEKPRGFPSHGNTSLNY